MWSVPGSWDQAYAGISEAEVVGVANARSEAAAAEASTVGAKPCGSYEGLAAAEDPDWIDTCLPTPFPRDLAIQVASKGRHVILGKPMTRHPEDAKKILKAFSNSHPRLFVARIVRLFPGYIKLDGRQRALRRGSDRANEP